MIDNQLERFLAKKAAEFKATTYIDYADFPTVTIGYGTTEKGKITLDLTPLADFFKSYGWEIKTGEEQFAGSCADIFATFYGNEYYILIEDGNVTLKDASVFIFKQKYGHQGELHPRYYDQIFGGEMQSESDLAVLFRMLGFEKSTIKPTK